MFHIPALAFVLSALMVIPPASAQDNGADAKKVAKQLKQQTERTRKAQQQQAEKDEKAQELRGEIQPHRPAAHPAEGAFGITVFRGRVFNYQVVDGMAVHAGDMILGTADEVARWTTERSLLADGLPGTRGLAPAGFRQDGSPCLWPDGIIPYVIDDGVPGREKILRAIRAWDTKTVLRFVERTSQHEDYLRFTPGSVSGTWLCAGNSPGNVIIQIEPGGSNYEVLLHGIGHAIGLEHEQQRRDRDRYVRVFSENIAATPYARGAWHPNVGLGPDIGPYDYRSIMTYPEFDHAKRRNHARTYLMGTIPPGMPFGGSPLGELAELSPGDIDSVARLYGRIPSRHVIATNPGGLEIIVDGERMTAPASFSWQPGSAHTLEAPSPQFRPGSRFLFGRWSDDGARAHTITATRDTTLYYANFIAQHQVSTTANVSCRGATTCSPDDGSVTITPTSPDGYYTLRTPIEVSAMPTPGSAVRFLRWAVSGDLWWSWWWVSMHGEASNPARTRVGPGLAYRASFVDGPIFRVDSNVDPVPVVVGGSERRTPVAFRADDLSVATVTPRLIESRGRGYRHRFRSWSDGGDMTHAIEVPQDADSALTLTLDTEYRLTTRAWQDWWNSIDTVPASEDGFYPEGAEVRLLAVAKPPAKFVGWNGAVAGRDAAAVVVMDDGRLAEAVFDLDMTELQSGVPAHVSLQWQGTDLKFHELDSERYYVQMPADASELEIEFRTQTATPGAEAGLWAAGQDLWPGWVKSHETADLILRDGVAKVRIRPPVDRWPAAYNILVRAAESNSRQTQTLEGTLVARVKRYGNVIIQASPRAFTFVSPSGYNPAPQTTRLTHVGSGSARYRIESNRPWLAASPQEWTRSGAGTTEISVTVNSAGLPPETHKGELTIVRVAEDDSPDGMAPTGIEIPVVFANVGPPSENAPSIPADGIVLATETPLVNRISPNALISVFGQGFAPPGTLAPSPALNPAGRVAANLAATCLEIGGKRAPLFYVAPTQINAQVPHDLAPGEAALTVIRGCGTANEQRSAAASATVAAVSPAFFNVLSNLDGRNPLVALHGGGPALVGAPGLLPGAEFTPAEPGEFVTLFGTGFGVTQPPLATGQIPGAAVKLPHDAVAFTFGGIAVPPQDVLYAGVSPCCAGLYQFTVRVPPNLPDSDAPVTATVNGVSTPQGPFLTVRRQQ